MTDLDIKHGFTAYRNGDCRCDECRESHRVRTAEVRAAVKGLCPADQHGTRNGYDHYGCRCRPCVAAHNAARDEHLERTSYRHGTYSAYASRGCRCRLCRAAKTAYDRKYRAARKALVAIEAAE